ncbi:ras GTPase-activating protein nGAP-like isoform X6 [Haliotis rufescens]|uniref:ras GTPase-activating protein nGAP-like isoform X6 n=1 Tax=Haliotis rufescens TaxID=6454 RepID=UPI001EAFF121|nr:ras GTPase-activating protein nGAP-like isoform X6 [Haliotis rufescens]
MAGKRTVTIESFPCRVEGWLNVWELDHDFERRVFGDGHQPLPQWEPFFCVILQDIGSLTLHLREEFAEERSGFRPLRRIRLDGGKPEFDKRWGYETLESIKENAIQHTCSQASAESFFKSRTFQIRNESLPDLSRSLDFEPGRGHFFRKIFNSSFEKVSSNERRGSVPLVSAAGIDDDVMDSPSTSSRLVNFFTKKGFKTNLKRTKSVTKLDRKRSGSNVSENDTHSLVGSLKRSMSLSRLNRKRNRPKSIELEQHVFPCECVVRTPENDHTWSLISSRIRTSRSHESLLTNPSSMHSIDLTAPDLEIKPLHSSVLGQDHCFQVSTSHGSKYISCRTAEERDKWIESLRRTVRPNQEECRRTDNSMKLWVIEAKNVSPKKRYFCEILLDKTLYARTSSKPKNDMLFWGEHFEFNNLPPVEFITVNLFREADRKKKKDKNTLVGYINIPVTEISNRQFVEKWFTAASGTVGKAGKETKSDLPILRLKARYQTVQILPIELYQDLVKYLTTDYCQLCEAVEPLMNVREKEDLATTLVHIMQKLNRAKNFLSDVVMAEIARLDNEHLTFRGNSIATKAMEAYMKLVGEKYLQDTLGEFVKSIIESLDDCEVDPTKVPNNAQLQCHQKNLDMYSQMAWVKIINSYCYFPSELKEVFASFRDRCRQRGKEDFSDNLISASIFLRFLCPAILSPSLFKLTQEYPQERAARNLTLIAKTIQTLANFTKFGGKEEFMTFMNSFVEREATNMKNFLKKISSLDGGNQFLEYDGFIDLGKELSIIYTLLKEYLDKAPEATRLKLKRLEGFLVAITDALENPEVGKTKPENNRKSQAYDNMMSTPSSQINTSPTEVLRDMLRQCGESADDLPIFASRKAAQNGGTDSTSSSEGVPRSNGSYTHYNTYSYSRSYRSAVANVSVRPQSEINEQKVNESWNQIVNAAENVSANNEYIDLIPFMDEDQQNSSMELEPITHGSQMSISQMSTVASSGYQSFGYSQSNSPVDPANQPEYCREITKSPVIHYPMQPLSFSNPLYKHQQKSSRGSTPPSLRHVSSSDSYSSDDEASTVKHRSPVKLERRSRSNDPLRKLSQLSSSTSNESLSDKPLTNGSQSSSSNNPISFSLGPRSSSPLQATSSPRPERSCSYYDTMPQDRQTVRPYQLSHSMDFGCLQQQQYSDQLRRTATDSVISQNSSPAHSCSSGSLGHNFSRDDTLSWSSRRLSPQSAVHMGISSVQRKLQEQERTKQEFESDVAVLRTQLQEAQVQLREAEGRLHDHEAGTRDLIHEWQHRLEMSEERMKKQQEEKDGQMQAIINRLVSIEEELKHEQQQMQKIVTKKQEVIDAQERRIHTLDSANSKLLQALNDLKERYNTTQSRNGISGPPRAKITAADLGGFKSSSC